MNMKYTIDKTQKIVSYVSGAGLIVYEIIQYNANAKDWYIVGDSSTNENYIKNSVELHNLKLQIT